MDNNNIDPRKEDEESDCLNNPVVKNNEVKDKTGNIFSFIEKKKKIKKISIKLKNKQNAKTFSSSIIINSTKYENEKGNFKNNSLSRNEEYFKLFDSRAKKLKLPRLIPFRIKKCRSNYQLNFFNDYENNFFFDSDYSFLEYNATEILTNKSKYKRIIIDKINNLKKGGNYKNIFKLEKKFYFGKNKKEVNLILNTLTISFKDMSLPPELQNNNLKLNLPISLLPLFYYKGIESFQKLLSAIIKVENNFEKIYLDDKALKIALNNISDFKTNEENNLINSNIKNNKTEVLKSPILQKDNNFLNFNYFVFFWVTNTKNYMVKITLPFIDLDIIDTKTSLKIFIDYELLFYLFGKNFKYWEFYVIKYLSTFSKYRNIFQQLGKNTKYNNKTFFLKEPKTRLNTFAQEILINLYTDRNNINQIITFKSFYILVNLIDEKFSLSKEYKILFNFFQYVKLIEIAKYSNKIDFLIKFLEIDTETHTLTFNFKKYDEFDAKLWMENIMRFSDNNFYHKEEFEEELLYSEFKVYNKKVKIEYKNPLWSIMKLENSKEITKTWEIGKDMDFLLIESIINPLGGSWSLFLNECLKKIDEPFEEIPNFKRSIFKRKSTKKKK